MTNNNYFIIGDGTETAALTPKTRIIISPNGVNVKGFHGETSDREGCWHYLPTGCVTSLTLEELLEKCMDGDAIENHNFIAVDTVVLTATSLLVSTYKVRKPLII